MSDKPDFADADKTARFWDQWTGVDCKRMAAAYRAARAECDALREALSQYAYGLGLTISEARKVLDTIDAARKEQP